MNIPPQSLEVQLNMMMGLTQKVSPFMHFIIKEEIVYL